MAAFDSLYVASSPRLLEQELRMLKQPSENTLASVEELDKRLLFKGLIDDSFKVDSIVDAILCDKPVTAVKILSTSKNVYTSTALDWFKINRKSILWSVAVGETILTIAAMIYYIREGKYIDGYTCCDAICNSVLTEFDISNPKITSYQLQTIIARKLLERVWIYMSDTSSQYLTDVSLGKRTSKKGLSKDGRRRAKKGIVRIYTEAQALRVLVRELILDGDIELLEEKIIEAIDVHTHSKGSRLAERKATLRRPTYICKLSSIRSSAYNALAIADTLITLGILGTIVDTNCEAATTVLDAIEENSNLSSLDISAESAIARRTIAGILKNSLGAQVCNVALYSFPEFPSDDATDSEFKRFVVELLGNVSLKDVHRGIIGVEAAARMLAQYVNISTSIIGRMRPVDIKHTLDLCIKDRRQFVRGILTACISVIQLYSTNSDTISKGVKIPDRLSSAESKRVRSIRRKSKYIQRRALRRKRHLSAPVNSVTVETVIREQHLPLIVLSTPRGTTYPRSNTIDEIDIMYGCYHLSAFSKLLIDRHCSGALDDSFYEGYNGVIGCRTKLELSSTPSQSVHTPYSDRHSIETCISRAIASQKASPNFSITLGDPLWRVIGLDRELIRAMQNDTVCDNVFQRLALRVTEWDENPEYIHTVIGESR